MRLLPYLSPGSVSSETRRDNRATQEPVVLTTRFLVLASFSAAAMAAFRSAETGETVGG
jgi:hypothetical protein